MKARKRPVVVEVWQWNFSPNQEQPPKWIEAALMAWPRTGGIAFWPDGTIETPSPHLEIATMEGNHYAMPGDWIIRGVEGELYPCKPDIFEKTYDLEGPKTVSEARAALYRLLEDDYEATQRRAEEAELVLDRNTKLWVEETQRRQTTETKLQQAEAALKTAPEVFSEIALRHYSKYFLGKYELRPEEIKNSVHHQTLVEEFEAAIAHTGEPE